MNIKILKTQLVTLFILTITTIGIFYYRDSMPDNYSSISSDSTLNFFSYYLTSFLNYINYYTGPWVALPFAVFTVFYIFIFSKRADTLDLVNFFSLSLFTLSITYFLAPKAIGAGLFQTINSNCSNLFIFLIFSLSLVSFLWGSYRGNFLSFLKSIPNSFKSPIPNLSPINFQFKLQTYYSAIVNKFKRPSVNTITYTPISIDEVKPHTMAVTESSPVIFCEQEQKIAILPSAAPDSAVEDNDIIDSHVKIKQKISDDKYYGLIKITTHQKPDQRVGHPDDKYFLDIISKIQFKLAEFKIEGRIINVLKGPVVDTFEWELGTGEKISKLTSAVEDLSLALLGAPIRMVYPMKGRGTVGIEVPRNPREIIFLDEMINSKEFINTTHQLPLAMGKDAFGEPVVVDLASMPHMLVAGSTGAGKSVFINSILVSLLIKKSPNQMKLILIDPKQLELALYAKLPHLILPVVTDAKTASIALLWACQEMERRYSIMTEFGVRNIEGFNHKLKRATPDLVSHIRKYYSDSSEETYELPYIVVIIDEFADLILTQVGKDIERNICRLAAKARASGIHLVVATQRPSVDVITGLIKSNFPTRVSFRVTSAIDSRTILNAMGAEKLLGKGDMLYKYGVDTTRIHSSFVDEDEIEQLAIQLLSMPPTFSPEVMEFIENGGEEDTTSTAGGIQVELNGKDEKYDEAVRVVMEHRSASASLIQRRLGVGYNRAANLIEEMEANGIVGPAQGAKPRKVLFSSDSAT
jgi:S-DNA-T family DNA segregation ATPase FtsK/SpoIIIE